MKTLVAFFSASGVTIWINRFKSLDIFFRCVRKSGNSDRT